ncbi:hypothetical protein [Pseudomonas sp. TE50-2]|uniref:hypothetical protein n=1 Tax=Pseudomonas sp. TE50-2 TaxID=3142707 RepID=UPI003466EA65
MSVYDWLTTGALGLIGVILLVLLVQYMRLREIWIGLSRCREMLRWAKIFESENRELKRSLRAQQRLTANLKAQMDRLNISPNLEEKH